MRVQSKTKLRSLPNLIYIPHIFIDKPIPEAELFMTDDNRFVSCRNKRTRAFPLRWNRLTGFVMHAPHTPTPQASESKNAASMGDVRRKSSNFAA